MYKKVLTTLSLLCILQWSVAQDLTLDLEAHYCFDSTLIDKADFFNHAELVEGTLSYEEGVFDQAIYFDGQTSIRTMDPFYNEGWEATTVSLWFKSENITGQNQILLQGANVGFGIFLEPLTGKIIGFYDLSSADAVVSQEVLTDNNWHHILTQSDGTTTSLYVDGVLQGTRDETMFIGDGRSNNRLFMGQSNQTKFEYIGLLDEVRIYSRVLTADELVLISTKGRSANESIANNKLSIFPNPTTDYININSIEEQQWTLYSTSTGIVMSGRSNKIDLHQIAAGVYFLKIQDQVYKVVKTYL